MIAVDRLVLDLPGFEPARAAGLARAVGALLAEHGVTGVDRFEIVVAAAAPSDREILAALAAALRARAI